MLHCTVLEKLPESENEQGEDDPISHRCQDHPRHPGSLVDEGCCIFRWSPGRIKGHCRWDKQQQAMSQSSTLYRNDIRRDGRII